MTARQALPRPRVPLQEPLPELLKRLVGTAERIDSDVRAHVTAYSEKKASLVAADRRRTGNFMVAALEDLVTPAMLDAAGAEVQVRRPCCVRAWGVTDLLHVRCAAR